MRLLEVRSLNNFLQKQLSASTFTVSENFLIQMTMRNSKSKPCAKLIVHIELLFLRLQDRVTLLQEILSQRCEQIADITVIPRFWSIDRNGKSEALRSAGSTEGFAGIIATRRGLAIRAWSAKVGHLRKVLMSQRITKDNIDIVPSITYDSTGWPSSASPNEIIHAIAHSCGTPPIPTRCFRALGVVTWTLGFAVEPKCTKFSVSFNGTTYEILLTRPVEKVKPIRGYKQPSKGISKGAKPPKESPIQIPDETSDRLTNLETKFAAMERRQDPLETKLQNGFEGVQDQLRQVLNAVQPRSSSPGHTGFTPPPKIPKSSWPFAVIMIAWASCNSFVLSDGSHYSVPETFLTAIHWVECCSWVLAFAHVNATGVEFVLHLQDFVIWLHTCMLWIASTVNCFGFCIENTLCSANHQNHCLCVRPNAFGLRLGDIHIDHRCGLDFAFQITLSTNSWKVQPFMYNVFSKCFQPPRCAWLIFVMFLIHDFISNLFYLCRILDIQGTFAVWCYLFRFCFWGFQVLFKCMANWYGSGFRWFVDFSLPVLPVKSRSDHDAIHQSFWQKSCFQISHFLMLIVFRLSSHRWQPFGLTNSLSMQLITYLYRILHCGSSSIHRLSNVHHHRKVSFDFDSLLGYPGEGPQSTWTCCTANIDAVQTHPDCLSWDFDAVALQETRINQTVHQQVSFDLKPCNKSLIHGGLLIPKKTKASTFVTPHGGVAIIASKGLMRKFSGDDDLTGLWSDLALTTRISAAWIQVLPKLRALIFTFYGETSRHDNSHLKINDFYLEKILRLLHSSGTSLLFFVAISKLTLIPILL